MSLQGVIINSEDLNEHLLNLPSLTWYFPFLSTLSHSLWNLTNGFMWLIHQTGKLGPFWLWVEMWTDREKWTDISIFKLLCCRYRTRRFMSLSPLSVFCHMHDHSVTWIFPNYVFIAIFQESSFLLLHDSNSADENYFSRKTLFLVHVKWVGKSQILSLASCLHSLLSWPTKPNKKRRLEPGLSIPASMCSPLPQH